MFRVYDVRVNKYCKFVYLWWIERRSRIKSLGGGRESWERKIGEG